MGTATPRNGTVLGAEANAIIDLADNSARGDDVDTAFSNTASVADVIQDLRVHQLELEAQNNELLRTQAELTESRDRYCDLFDTAPVGYLTLDPKGKIVAANLTASSLLRHDRDELIGRSFQAIVSPDEANQLHRLYADVLSGIPHQNCDLEIFNANAGVTFLHVQCSLSVQVVGQEPSIRMTLSDVTSLKEAEARRTELELRLQLKQRLASLGVLAGGIAHDFNNLLFGIMTHADLLMQTQPTESQHSSIRQIHAAATQSASLCGQMLDFAGNQHLGKSVFLLSDIVDETSDLLSPTFKTTKVKLSCSHPTDLFWTEGDVTRIRQVVMNIILNAAEAIGIEEGTVSVTTGCVLVDSDYLAATQVQDDLSSGKYVSFEVVDSGCGISQQALEKVFEPFFTTKFTGRGLGLASVLGIVRSHGGTVKIESVVGSGTTVRVLLPAIAKPATSRVKIADRDVGANRECTVLLIDDEQLVRDAMRAKLQRKGHTVMTATDGATALAMLKQHLGEVDVVVLDLTMPGLSTSTICESLHQMVPDLPVLLTSGFTKEEALTRCDYSNIAGFVPKPMGDIAQAISKLFRPNDC